MSAHVEQARREARAEADANTAALRELARSMDEDDR